MTYFITFLLAILTAVYSQFFWLDVFSQDLRTYCEYGGIYYENIDEMYQAILNDDYSVISGGEYAYGCNTNQLNIDSIAQFDAFTIYGVTRGNVNQIPAEIDKIGTLEKLQVQDQKLTNLPDEIGNLSNLSVLKLGGNNITHLNPTMANLKNLEALYLYRNRLKNVPETIGQLDSLKLLDLRYNRLTELPETIGNLSDSLEVAYLGGNFFDQQAKEKIRSLLPHTTIYF